MSPNDAEKSVSLVRGLNDGETIEWSENAGFSLRPVLRNGCLPMLVLILAPIIMDPLVTASPAGLLIIVAIYNVVAPPLLLLLFLYIVYFLVQVKRTRYYITSQRLLEVRGEYIKKEIPRVNLQGLTPDQYLNSVLQEKHASSEYYDLHVTDGVSGVVMRMTSMGPEVAERIKRWAKKST